MAELGSCSAAWVAAQQHPSASRLGTNVQSHFGSAKLSVNTDQGRKVSVTLGLKPLWRYPARLS